MEHYHTSSLLDVLHEWQSKLSQHYPLHRDDRIASFPDQSRTGLPELQQSPVISISKHYCTYKSNILYGSQIVLTLWCMLCGLKYYYAIACDSWIQAALWRDGISLSDTGSVVLSKLPSWYSSSFLSPQRRSNGISAWGSIMICTHKNYISDTLRKSCVSVYCCPLTSVSWTSAWINNWCHVGNSRPFILRTVWWYLGPWHRFHNSAETRCDPTLLSLTQSSSNQEQDKFWGSCIISWSILLLPLLAF